MQGRLQAFLPLPYDQVHKAGGEYKNRGEMEVTARNLDRFLMYVTFQTSVFLELLFSISFEPRKAGSLSSVWQLINRLRTSVLVAK